MGFKTLAQLCRAKPELQGPEIQVPDEQVAGQVAPVTGPVQSWKNPAAPRQSPRKHPKASTSATTTILVAKRNLSMQVSSNYELCWASVAFKIPLADQASIVR